MPSLKRRVKTETSLPKIGSDAGRLKGIELSASGMANDVVGAPQARNLSDNQQRWGVQTGSGPAYSTKPDQVFVPVIDQNQQPLMPTIASRARRWIASGKATGLWKKGVFCVRLNVEPSGGGVQGIAVGVDPGSKKEGFTVKSDSHTYLNIQADAVTWVKKAVEVRRNARRTRLYRNTPCRENRMNRARGTLPPSTKARWQWKLRILAWLGKIFPITVVVVEDIKAKTMCKRKWDTSFSPLEVGKQWFYGEVASRYRLETKQGWETKELRDTAGLKKSSSKLSNRFDAHCVDSWVLANWWTGGHIQPDNERMLLVSPIQLHRRMLHKQNPQAGGKRPAYGGTRSLGFKRGSLIQHPKWGIAYVGGTMGDRISLHSLTDGKRLAQNINPADCVFRTFNTQRTAIPLPPKVGSLLAGNL